MIGSPGTAQSHGRDATVRLLLLAVCLAAASISAAQEALAPLEYSGARLVTQNGSKTREVEVIIRYEPDSLVLGQPNVVIQRRGEPPRRVAIVTIPYAAITRVEYDYSISPVLTTFNHWLTIHARSSSTMLRLDKSNYVNVVAELATRSRVDIDTPALKAKIAGNTWVDCLFSSVDSLLTGASTPSDIAIAAFAECGTQYNFYRRALGTYFAWAVPQRAEGEMRGLADQGAMDIRDEVRMVLIARVVRGRANQGNPGRDEERPRVLPPLPPTKRA